ncbi:predicted protein [Micromonas commoda]|uniref:Conserved oligomeric Golgi complex subunit 4 C-terminal domain-containing protein n=1 Tax=Micromonas commoda (strain RCC299 / NOUM17 / CCMP2709) TaxID=296587 RepID=C1FDY4_MICCC|nr:predicted protein [Micromonas commoda]ACO68867.1 predicted protein [Micromonas commoda]|eukprot:XP_002507609.1 predicted protein [Micromonas commoda]
MNADSLFLEETMDVGAINRLLHEAAHSHRALAMRLLRASHVGQFVAGAAHDESDGTRDEADGAHYKANIIHVESLRLLAKIITQTSRSTIIATAQELCTERQNISAAQMTVNHNVRTASTCSAMMECLHRNEYEATVQHAHTLQSMNHYSEALKISVNDIETQHLYTRVRLSISEVTKRLKENLDVAIARGDEDSVLRFAKLFATLGLPDQGLKSIDRVVVMRACAQKGNDVQIKHQIFNMLDTLFDYFECNWRDILATFGLRALNALVVSVHEACESHTESMLATHLQNFDNANESGVEDQLGFSNIENVIVEMVEVITRLAEYRSYIEEFCRSIDKVSASGDTNCTHQRKIAMIFSRILSKFERTYSDLEVRQVQSEKKTRLLGNNYQILIPTKKGILGLKNLDAFVDDFFFLTMSSINRAVHVGYQECTILLLNLFREAALRHVSLDDELNNKIKPMEERMWRLRFLHIFLSNLFEVIDFVKHLKRNDKSQAYVGLPDLEELSKVLQEKLLIERDLYMKGLFSYFDATFDCLASTNYVMSEEDMKWKSARKSWSAGLIDRMHEAFDMERVFSSELNEIISDPIITHIARRIEENVFNRLQFNHLGAILFEGEIRKITVALTKMFPNSKVREIFSRVLSISTVLNAETYEGFFNDINSNFFLHFELEKLASLRNDL